MHLLGQGSRPGPATGRTRKAARLSWPATYSLQRGEHLERSGLDGGHRSAGGDPFGAGGVGAACYGGEVDWQDVAIRNVRYSLRTNRFDLPQARNRGQSRWPVSASGGRLIELWPADGLSQCFVGHGQLSFSLADGKVGGPVSFHEIAPLDGRVGMQPQERAENS